MNISINGELWNTAAPDMTTALSIRRELERLTTLTWQVYHCDRDDTPSFVVVPDNLSDDAPLLTLGLGSDPLREHLTENYPD